MQYSSDGTDALQLAPPHALLRKFFEQKLKLIDQSPKNGVKVTYAEGTLKLTNQHAFSIYSKKGAEEDSSPDIEMEVRLEYSPETNTHTRTVIITPKTEKARKTLVLPDYERLYDEVFVEETTHPVRVYTHDDPKCYVQTLIFSACVHKKSLCQAFYLMHIE